MALIAGLVTLLCSVGLAVFAGWVLHQYRRFSPVYVDVECRLAHPEIRWLSYVGGFHMDFTTRTSCYNPNHYDVTLRRIGGTRILVGPDREQVAVVEDAQELTLPARRTKLITSHYRTQQTGRTRESLFVGHARPHTEVLVASTVGVDIRLGFLLKRFETQSIFDRTCGFELQTYGSPRAGPMGCAEGGGQLHVPPLGPDAGGRAAEAYSYGISADDFDRASRAKDLGLWLCFAISALGGLVLFVVGVQCLCRSAVARDVPRRLAAILRRGKGRSAPAKEEEKDEEEPADAIGAAEDTVAEEAGAPAGPAAGGGTCRDADDVECTEMAEEGYMKAEGCGCLGAAPPQRAAGAGA